MKRVLHRSIVLTLEIVPSGVSKCKVKRATVAIATVAIASEWLRHMGRRVKTSPAKPACQIYMRQLPPSQGIQIQVLLCWIVLQAQRQEINDFERPP